MLYLNFADFPILTTARLILRQLTHDDLPQLHKLRSNPGVNELIGRQTPKYISETKSFIRNIHELTLNNEGIYWAITLRGNKDLIGTICFWNFDNYNERIEIGYELLPEFQRKGIMIEAVNRVINYGFEEMEAKTIMATTTAANINSIALLEKTNFRINRNAFSFNHEDVCNEITYLLNKSNYVG